MSIENLVNYFKKTDLTGNDIIKLTGKPPVIYSDFKKYKNVNSLLGSQGYIIILYQTSSKTTGHFCCLSVRNDELYWFDSYGFAPDAERQYTPYDQKLPRYLTQLLEADGRPILWNKHDYQSKDITVATCGRWSAVKCLLKDLSPQDFQHIFYTNKDPYLTSDNLIVMLTLIGLNNINEYFEKN